MPNTAARIRKEIRSYKILDEGLRAVGGGALSIGLAILNFPLMIFFIVALALTPVLGIGIVILPLVTELIRRRADVTRKLSGSFRVPIGRPYRPMPAKAQEGVFARWKWIITDPATWRDFAWLTPGALIGLSLGIVTLVLPLYGLEGITLTPLWIWMGTGWYGYGALWPIRDYGDALLSLPQGAMILLLGLAVAPYLRRFDAQFARLLLAPTRNAELEHRVTELTVTRADTIDAQAAELRRIERDLHDGTQARLASLGMTIGLAEEMIAHDPAKAVKLLAEAREASTTALVELRHLVRGIHPPVLAERGLDGAVRALALSLRIPTNVDSDLSERMPSPVESAAYFAVAESLANMVAHSGATFGFVMMRRDGDTLHIEVGDDGAGGADPARGSGLLGIQRRLAAFDGTMALSSPTGGPTIVTMELPCVSFSPKTVLSSGTD